MIVWLVRHGSTGLNTAGKFRAWLDPPLDQDGLQTAQELAADFANQDIAKIVSSDLDRAKRTAEIISDRIGLEIEIDSDLRPWNLGDLAGQPIAYNKKTLQNLIDDPDSRPPGDGESLNEFTMRNKTALRIHFRKAENEGPQIFVLHTSNIINIIHEDHGMRPEEHEILEPGEMVLVSGAESNGGYTMAIYDNGPV